MPGFAKEVVDNPSVRRWFALLRQNPANTHSILLSREAPALFYDFLASSAPQVFELITIEVTKSLR
jgi:hypothetical protein